MIVDSSGNELTPADQEGNCRRWNEPLGSKPLEIELDSVRSKRIKRSRNARRNKMEFDGGINSLSREKIAGDAKRTRSEKAPAGGGSRFGMASHLGRREAMEDAVAAELGFLSRGRRSYDFYGVYDGHGGRRVANACSETMHKLLAKVLEGEIRAEIDWGETMTASFRGMDEEVNKIGDEVATVGSTAVVAVVGEEEVVVANCGDSRAVLCRGGVAVPMSDDHKPDRADELERIEVCGGKVINWDGARVLGVLATSRSIGDQYLKPYVISEPEVKVIDRTGSDEFLILASDGLWDVVSNHLACQVTRRCLDGRVGAVKDESNNCAEAARVLAELAMVRGGSDNVSVIVVNMSR